MPYLTITVRFLDGHFHGRTDSGASEWPPSPMRLFQAIVAGVAPPDEAQFAALQWLEQQGPPIIQAPSPVRGAARLAYVPNNNTDTVRDPAKLRTGKTIQPLLLSENTQDDGDDSNTVRYRWAFDETDRPHARTVASLAFHIRALGWGIDLAIGHGLLDGVPEPSPKGVIVYRPVPSAWNGGQALRTPCPGSIESLRAAHEASLERIGADGVIRDEPDQKRYESITYSTAPSRPFCAFALLSDEDEFVPFRPHQIKGLLGMARNLLDQQHIRNALGPDTVERVLLGHPKDQPGPRASILPLPTIGHPHSDGWIRRLLFAAPPDQPWIAETLAPCLHGQTLQPNTRDIPSATFQRINPTDNVVRRYTLTARTWASATPLLLPGYDDRKQHRGNQQKRLNRAEQLVKKAIQHTGIQTRASVAVSRVPYWPNTLHARQHRPRCKLQHYPRYHLKLTFDVPISGPLALGAGRHAGFGVMAAWDDGD